MLRRRDGGDPLREPTPTDKAVVWATTIAAELPDLDVLFGSQPMDQYRYHRAHTHSLLFAPLVALIATAAVKLVWRKARVGPIYLWSLLAVVIGHLVNDWMTGWGTRLLLPFSEARLGLDWVPIIDLLYTLPLLASVIWAWRRPRLRRRLMVGVLGYLAIYTFGYRGISHAVVEAKVAEAYTAGSVQQMRIAPDLLNPLAWQYTVDLGDRFEQGRTSLFGGIGAPEEIAKPAEDAVIQAVRRAPELAPYFDQFSYVLIDYRKVGDGYEVQLGDVRYRFGGVGVQTVVSLTPDLQVREIH